MQGVEKSRPLLIYCQSAECDFAKRVAGRLYLAGRSDISILQGGWVGWVSSVGQVAELQGPHEAVLE